MKKRVTTYLSAVVLIFLVGGIYIILSIQAATSKLDRLIKLHQVEILREHLLIQIHKVQEDFLLMDSVFASSHDAMAANVSNMQSVSTTCTECHHRPAVQERLDRLMNEIDSVRGNLQRFLTSQTMGQRSLMREMAYQLLEHLEIQVNGMIHIATTKLTAETNGSMDDIAHSKMVLYGLVVLTPLVAGVLAFFFMREISKPVELLLEATRKLRGGDMSYHIDGLDQEFGEVATSFNQMSDALRQKMFLLEESEKRYRMLFESAGDAIFILEAEGDARGRIVAANRAAAEMHGYTVNELLQLGIADLDTPEAAQHVPDRVRRMLLGEWIKEELDHRRKDGSVFPVEISAGLMELENHRYILAFDRDITERREMENQLRRSEQEWIDTFNTITDMVTLHDHDFNILKANTAARELLNLTANSSMRAKCYQCYHGRKEPPKDCPSCECFRTGKPASFDVYEPHLGKMLEVRAIPRFDADGQLIGVLHVSRDISERKRMEENMRRAEQMKVVGEWATALAHEIKNPLAGIKVSVEVLAEELETEEDREVVKRAVQEIKRIETLLKSLLNFAKPPKPQLNATDLNELLSKTLDFSLKHVSRGPGGKEKIKIERDFGSELAPVMVDPMQFQQIFLNLILNATEAMPKGGQLIVRTRHNPTEKFVVVEIRDTGKGIEKGDLDKIFQPFFTTKKKGTGLGLAITKRLVEQHDGKISIHSEPGKETTVSIVLPANNTREGRTT